MLFSNENGNDLEKLEELASLENQVKEVRLHYKLAIQSFYENIEKVFEPVTDTMKNTSEKITKTITESSITHNKAVETINEKVSELMNNKGMIAPHLASFLVNLFKPENKIQLKSYQLLIRNTSNSQLYQSLNKAIC